MGILQQGILVWVATPSSRGSSQPRNWTQVSCTKADSLPSEPPGNLYKKGKFGHWQERWRMPFEDEVRNNGDVSTSQGTPKITRKPPKTRREERNWCIATILRRNQSCQHLYHGCLASITVRQYILSSLWYFVTASLGKHKKRYPK